MRQTSGSKGHGEKIVKDIRRATRKQYSAEEKIRNVLDGLKGEDSIAELCRHEGPHFASGVYPSDPFRESAWARSHHFERIMRRPGKSAELTLAVSLMLRDARTTASVKAALRRQKLR